MSDIVAMISGVRASSRVAWVDRHTRAGSLLAGTAEELPDRLAQLLASEVVQGNVDRRHRVDHQAAAARIEARVVDRVVDRPASIGSLPITCSRMPLAQKCSVGNSSNAFSTLGAHEHADTSATVLVGDDHQEHVLGVGVGEGIAFRRHRNDDRFEINHGTHGLRP